jgi:hypothetical protein
MKKKTKLRLTHNYHSVDEGMWLRAFENQTGKYRLEKQLYLRKGDRFRTDGCYVFVSPRDWLEDDAMSGPLIRVTGVRVR